MKTDTERQSVESLEIRKEIAIAAPIEIAFGAVLDELGPEGQMPGGKPFPMTIEPWPGGRWYRDLGNNSGHLGATCRSSSRRRSWRSAGRS
jgi:hypothetical protein